SNGSKFFGSLFQERTVFLPTDLPARTKALASQCALGIDVERVQRLARRHEQAVPPEAAEAEIGAALRQMDVADRLARGVEHAHAVQVGAHAPSAPEIAVDVAA